MLSKQNRHSREADPIQPRLQFESTGDAATCYLSGNWTTARLSVIDPEVREVESRPGIRDLTLDLGGVERMDTAGAWLIQRLSSAVAEKGAQVRLQNASEDAETLLAAVANAVEDSQGTSKARRGVSGIVLDALEKIGKAMYRVVADGKLGLHILGATIRGAQMKFGRGHGVNPAAIASQIERTGIGAIPVVVMMSVIVGAIVAQQGAFQLRYFGAEIFVVDLVGILILREMGVLLTAIMIAGRSGSAITAEIGSMKMREEIDALTVIGLNPVGVLVFPRLVALMVALPCLTVISNFAALGGAMGIAWYYSGIPPEAFIDRLHAGIDLSTIFAGLIKAPFMALIIGIVGSVEGMKVEGSAESLGRRVTASVVKAIFIVIVVDGFFAIFYAAVDF